MSKCHHCKKSLSRSSSRWTCFKCAAVYHKACSVWQLSSEKEWVRCCTVWTGVSNLDDTPHESSEKILTKEKKIEYTKLYIQGDSNSKVQEENGSDKCCNNNLQIENSAKETVTSLGNSSNSSFRKIKRCKTTQSIDNCDKPYHQQGKEIENTRVEIDISNASNIKKQVRNENAISQFENNKSSILEKEVQDITSLSEISSNSDQEENSIQNVIESHIKKIQKNEDKVSLKPITTRQELIFELNKIKEELMAAAELMIEESLEKYYSMSNLLKVSFDVKGVIAPVFTPIEGKGSVNFSIIPEYITYLHANGVQGILVGGTTGESITLSLDERQAVFEAWVKVAKPLGMKVIMQVGGVPMTDVIKMAEYAEQLNADAIMTLPELYYKPKSTEHLVDYLHAVSNAAPSLPLLYYHFPLMSGVDVNIPEFFKLASSRIPNFKGMKADLGVALQVSNQLGEDQRIFIGNHLVAPAVLLGHDSSIATVTNMFPKLVKSLIDAVKAGDVEKAKVLQEKLNSLVSAIASQGEFLPAMKAAMPMVTGIDVGPPRRPNASLEEHKKTQLMENLEKLDFGRVN